MEETAYARTARGKVSAENAVAEACAIMGREERRAETAEARRYALTIKTNIAVRNAAQKESVNIINDQGDAKIVKL